MNDLVSRTHQSPIRVFLFAEHRIVLECLKHFIDSNQDMTVSTSGCLSHLNDLEISTYGTRSDVGVVYLSHSDQVQIVAQLLRSNPAIRVVVATEVSDLESQASALKLGAVGIVHKNQNPKFLIEAIRQTYKGETWLNQVLLHRIRESGKSNGKKPTKNSAAADADLLTKRELEVIQMIGEGLKNKILAKCLNISEATVRHHLSSIYAKIGVEDRLNLVILAYEKGLISYRR